jgi:hypothetical protein
VRPPEQLRILVALVVGASGRDIVGVLSSSVGGVVVTSEAHTHAPLAAHDGLAGVQVCRRCCKRRAIAGLGAAKVLRAEGSAGLRAVCEVVCDPAIGGTGPGKRTL